MFPTPSPMLGLLTGRLQGQLQMWVDMLTPAEAAKYPKTDISLPRPEELEVSVCAHGAKWGSRCRLRRLHRRPSVDLEVLPYSATYLVHSGGEGACNGSRLSGQIIVCIDHSFRSHRVLLVTGARCGVEDPQCGGGGRAHGHVRPVRQAMDGRLRVTEDGHTPQVRLVSVAPAYPVSVVARLRMARWS